MIKPEIDINFDAFQNLLKQDDWYNRYKGLYVVFVSGKLVDQGADQGILLERVMETYKGKPKYFTKVYRTPEMPIDIPTPFLD
jgi:hypothetical protein